MMLRYSTFAFALALAASAVFADEKIDIKWGNTELLAPGVIYVAGKVEAPQPMRVFCLRVDLKRAEIGFTATGKCDDWGKPLGTGKYTKDQKGNEITPAVARTTSETVESWFERMSLPKDKGGRELPMLAAFPMLQLRRPYVGKNCDPHGLLISDGEVVSDCAKERVGIFVVRKDGSVDIVENVTSAEYPAISLAASSHIMIRKDGKDIVAPARNSVGSRNVLGLSADKQKLFLLCIDGGVAGKTTEVGASHHDANAILETLGVSDAIGCAFYAYAGMVIRDKATGKAKVVNAMEGGINPPKVPVCIGIYNSKGGNRLSSSVAKEGGVDARFDQSRLVVVKEKPPHAAEITLHGQLRVGVKSQQQRIRRPILNVVGLFDVDGVWRMYDTLCVDLDTVAGICAARGQTPEKVSKSQPEVSTAAYSRAIFGDVKNGFFNGYGVNAAKGKLIGYRLELWQDGSLIAAYDSDKSAIRRAGAPEDWYVKGKYPGKITYRWPPPPAK